jgi:hypothetical protein
LAFREFEEFTKSMSALREAVERIRSHHAKRHPDVRIAAEDLCTERSSTQERRFDIAVVRRPVDEKLYESEPLFEEEFVALIADSDPLASRTSVTLAELATRPLLMYDRSLGPGVYDKTLALFDATGLRPYALHGQPPPYTQAAMMLVASGDGYYIGIASPFTQTHRASGVAVVPLDEPNARLDVRIAWRKGILTRAARDFVRLGARGVSGERARRSYRRRLDLTEREAPTTRYAGTWTTVLPYSAAMGSVFLSLCQDVRYAIRLLARRWSFAINVAATIGLGLGLLGSAFTLVNAYLLRPIDLPQPHALYSLGWDSASVRESVLRWRISTTWAVSRR